jgi:uncharacterized protein with FMN-binding domain
MQLRTCLGLGALFMLLSIPLFAGGQKDTSREPIDLNLIQDGIYQGEAKHFPVAVTVEVQTLDHRITSIVITRHREGKGEAAEAIVNDIIAAQSLDVDVVSRATLSSRTILDAVAAALKKGIAE